MFELLTRIGDTSFISWFHTAEAARAEGEDTLDQFDSATFTVTDVGTGRVIFFVNHDRVPAINAMRRDAFLESPSCSVSLPLNTP